MPTTGLPFEEDTGRVNSLSLLLIGIVSFYYYFDVATLLLPDNSSVDRLQQHQATLHTKVEINMKLLSSFLHTNKEPHVDFLRNTYCFPVARAEGQGSDFIPLPLKGGRLGCARTDRSSAPNHMT